MKVRIGLGLGTRFDLTAPVFTSIIDRLEYHRADSIWLSERVNGPAPDPLMALAVAAGRTSHLKLGTSVLVLPGRNPLLLAKALATLAVLSEGRLLPAVGLGAVEPVEQQAFGVERTQRAPLFEEMISIMRQCWRGESVEHHGEHFDIHDVIVQPTPPRLDVWLGGIAPAELRRVARHGDGWLPSFVTPNDVARGREVIERECATYDRSIDDDHYGVLIPYQIPGLPVPEKVLAGIARRRPDLDNPADLIPNAGNDLAGLIDEFIAVGATKFVVLPIVEPTGETQWIDHIDDLSGSIFALEREI